MRILSLTARTVRWPIAGVGAARGRGDRAAVIVEARSERGAIGLGEAAPLPGMSLDTLADAEQAIAGLALRAPIELADREAVAAWTAGAAAAPAARFALETALLDAMAHERGIPLSALLASPPGGHGGSPPPAAHRRLPRVPLAAVVDDPESARRAYAAGVRCFKLKLTADDPLARVIDIAAAAPGARLRIDANRSWPRAEVAERLAALAHLPVDYVEEPCADTHQLLASQLPCKLALDESLASLAPDELSAALDRPGLAAIVLKPALVGGLSAALALAARARRSGVAAIASHALEGPIGTAACAELALALGGSHAAGLAAHAALAGWAICVEQLAADHVRAVDRPGLGLGDLDLAAVAASAPAEPTIATAD